MRRRRGGDPDGSQGSAPVRGKRVKRRDRMGRLRLIAAALVVAGTMALGSAASASAALPVPYGSAGLTAFANAEVFTPTFVPGGNNIFCRPSAAHPYPVVLVHGTAEDEGSNWVTLAPLLANAGYCVFALNYGETALSLGGHVDGLGNI